MRNRAASDLHQPTKRAGRRTARLGITAALLAGSFVVGSPTPNVSAIDYSTSAFVQVDPYRAADTRSGQGFQRVDDNTKRLKVAGVNGVPADASAVAITIVATNASAPGYALTYPAGEARSDSSNLNYTPDSTFSTGAIVPLSADGSLDVYTLTSVDVIIDVTGAFVPRETSTSGRFRAVEPYRAMDSRESTPLAAGETRTVDLPVVWKGATAAMVTLTGTGPNNPGFFTAWAEGRVPDTSTVNLPTPDSTRATTAIVPLSDQSLKVYSSHGGNLIVDVVGFFTGPYAGESDEGLFVPMMPRRRLDTRTSYPMGAGESRSFSAEGGVAVGSLTMVTPAGPGFGALYANGTPVPKTSMINSTSEQYIANLAVTRVGRAGVSVHSSTYSNYVFDQFGYFTADLVNPTVPESPVLPPKPAPAPKPPSVTPSSGCGVSALLVPACGAWLGASIPSRDGNYTWSKGLAEYESVAQNVPDILHFYKNGNQTFPSKSELAVAERPGKPRSLLLYNWKPTGATWREVANGAADSQIANVANGLKKYPHKVFLNIYHEPEDQVRTSASSGMTVADYKAMYRHVVDKLRSHGVNNAVYVWNPMGYEGWRDYLDGLYPGDDYVDWMCYDPYAKDDMRKNLADIANRPRPNLGWPGYYDWATTKAPGKPLMMCEFGVDTISNSDPAAILGGDAEQLMRDFPMLKAFVYWNSVDSHVDTRIDNTSAKGRAYGDAYRQFANQPFFNAMSPDVAP